MATGTKSTKNRKTSKRNVAANGRSKQNGGSGANSRQNSSGATTNSRRTAASAKSSPRGRTSSGAAKTRANGAKTSAKPGARRQTATSTSDANRGSARERGPKSSKELSGDAKGADARYLQKHKGHLSASTLRAHWVSRPRNSAQRDGQTLATRNRDVIRQWAEERGGVPATVLTKKTTDRPRVLRIDFPGYSNGRLQEIAWDDWFRTFQQRDLVFLFQETTKDGKQSNFFRLDSPRREDG